MLCGIASVKLAGTDVTGLVTRLSISESIGESAVCTLETVINPIWEQSIEPRAFSELVVTDDDGNIIFGGRTNQQPQRTDQVSGARFTITATDWSAEAGLRFVDDHYSGWVASDVYKALVEKYLPGHLTSKIQENSTVVDLKFSGQTLSQCFKALCDLTQWSWKVDPDKVHYFGPQFVDILQTVITDVHADTTKGATTRFEKDYSTLANRVWVEGGQAQAQRKTRQYVALSDLDATENTDMSASYPLCIPVWYKCQEIEVFAVFDSGDGMLESGKLVRMTCSSSQNVSGKKTLMPEGLVSGVDYVKTYFLDQDNGMLVTGQGSTAVIPDYDCVYLDDSNDEANGGHVYLSKGTVIVMDRVNQKGSVTGLANLGSYYINTNLESQTTKMLGFMVSYRRLMKISLISDVDAESVEKYGVQIDLPKVSRPAIKDWSVLYRYADFLLQSHKDPPSKGRLAVWKYRTGQKIFAPTVKPGWLVSFSLERFGQGDNVKVTKVVHEIAPHSWRMELHSSLDPNLYQSMFSDILRRIAELEQENSSTSDVINSVRKIEQTQELGITSMIASTVDPRGYGFDRSDFGAGEWEG
ncbi:MAG: hypothetical protein HGA95_02980 [Caldiserica bacterium]|nr:hypothetical protein [Caldisericota bacterium]